MKNFGSKYKTSAVIILTVLGLCAAAAIFRPPCPIKHLTGLSCAGCGMTRAVISALKLDFGAAFEYHPLWIILLPFAVSCAVFVRKKIKRALFVLISVTIVLFIVTWLWRITLGDSVVGFDFENSVINKMIQKISETFA